jgi:hypothetical protein
MNQHVEVSLTLQLWLPAGLDEDAIATYIRTRLPLAFGEAITTMKDPVALTRVRTEAEICGTGGV